MRSGSNRSRSTALPSDAIGPPDRTCDPVPAAWVLLRGLSREARHWGAFADHLRRELDTIVICPDLPGFGVANERRSPRTVAGIADAVEHELRAQRTAGPWGVLGVSLGGMVALELSARSPCIVSRCVVVNTSAANVSRAVDRMKPGAVPGIVVGRRTRLAYERAVLRRTTNHCDDIEALARQHAVWARQTPPRRGAVVAQITAASRFHVEPRIDTPVLVLSAERDRLVSPRCSRQLAAHLDAPAAVHPTGGHDLAADDPDWITSNVLSWLRRGA